MDDVRKEIVESYGYNPEPMKEEVIEEIEEEEEEEESGFVQPIIRPTNSNDRCFFESIQPQSFRDMCETTNIADNVSIDSDFGAR